MGSVISAIETATPDYRISQDDILKFMVVAHQLDDRDTKRLKKLYEVSGIEYRYSVIPDFGVPPGRGNFFGGAESHKPLRGSAERNLLYEQTAWKVAKQAVDRLLEKNDVSTGSITHLITVSCTGMYAPGLDIDLIEQLGLSLSTERTCINFMGCYGAFNALKSADYICRARQDARVLIVDIELCTLHFQKENSIDNWIANSLFSDGAAAVLVESRARLSAPKGFCLHSFYNTLVPSAKSEMAWRIGDTGFEMKLSSHIAKHIKGKINQVMACLLQKSGLSIKDISLFAIHPGGRRILEVCEEMLELPEDALEYSYDILRKFGNMSSATILFILQKLMQKAESGEKLAAYAFGPGLTVESMILETV